MEDEIYQGALGISPTFSFNNDVVYYKNYRFWSEESSEAPKEVSGFDYISGFEHSAYIPEDGEITEYVDNVDSASDTVPKMFRYKIGVLSPYAMKICFKDDSTVLNLKTLVDSLYLLKEEDKSVSVPQKNLEITAESKNWVYKLRVKNVYLHERKDTVRLEDFKGDILIRKK